MSAPTLPAAFLQLLEESLAQSPNRGDLWMMRFDALKSMGGKAEFARHARQALADAAISRQLDWIELRSMWKEIAPGEEFPDGTEPVAGSVAPGAGRVLAPTKQPAPPLPLRRFRDVAQHIASAELAVLASAYAAIAARPGFLEDFARQIGPLLARPTSLELSSRLSQLAGDGMRVFLKREERRQLPVECEHAAAQCYIGSLLGKNTVVTGNDVDAHALEVATIAKFFNMRCRVVVRPDDFATKPAFIAELQALDAQVEPPPATGMFGTDPREGAVWLWKQSAGESHLVLSLGMAPQPHTIMANAFQAVVGREAESQYMAMTSLLRHPRTVVGAVGSEADSIGFVLPFLNRREIRVAYAEPEPGGPAAWRPSARLAPYNGQIREHTWLRGVGRIQYVPVSDTGAAAAQVQLAGDGINVGLEDARAVALALLLAKGDPSPRDFLVLVG